MQFLALCIVAAVVARISGSDCELYNIKGESKKTAEKLLERLGSLKGKELEVKDDLHEDHYLYKIGICKAVKSSSDVGIMQLKKDDKEPVAIGRINETSIIGGSNWMMMTYASGDRYRSHCVNDSHRQGHLMFICDKTATTPVVNILEENNEKTYDCYYLFEVSTSVICPEEKHHLSGWAIFFIILFCCAGAYLVIGVAYKRYILGNRGMDQIPNVNTWIKCGNASADLCDKLCRCNRRDELTYASVGQSLPSNPSPLDEDDQLLNT